MKKLLLTSNVLIGIFIAFAPIIITGRFYDETELMPDLLVAEFVIRSIAYIVGLVVINDGIKQYIKSLD